MTRNRPAPQPDQSAERVDTDTPVSSAVEPPVPVYTLSERIAAATEAAVAITRALELDKLFKILATRLSRLVKFDHLSICLRVDNMWRARTLAGQSKTSEAIIEEDDPIATAIMTHDAQLLLEGVPNGFLQGFGSAYIVPLHLESRSQIIGTLHVACVDEQRFNAEDVDVISLLARQVGAAVRNAERFQAMRAAKESLARYTVQLEERNQELDAYAYTVAHDLKAPLNLIYGYSHLLQGAVQDSSPEAQEYLGHINRAVDNMTRMIDQLLFLARLENQEESLVPVDTTMVLYMALERFRQQIQERGIQVDSPQEMPQVCGHGAWVEEVFANLIGNAIKYMGNSNPNPRISIRAVDEGSMVRFEVEDTGVGIAPADQMRLFERFTRLNTVKTDGNGLGLAIVHRIITRLNGQVSVESIPGEGSMFWFRLPAACD